MRKTLLTVVFTFAMIVLMTGTALAAHENPGDRTNTEALDAQDCMDCHTNSEKRTFGPHAGYTATTNKCKACHSVHRAKNVSLVNHATVTATCNFCHDLTGSKAGPYSMIDVYDPATEIKSAHKVFGDTDDVVVFNVYFTENDLAIPGGDYSTGGYAYLDTTYQARLSGNHFTCDSCHTPHGLSHNTVTPYLGDSDVKTVTNNLDPGEKKIYLTNRLLKRVINGVDTGGTYGSAWCTGCHRGRTDDHSMSTINHPVNENGKGYDYLGEGMNEYASWYPGRDISAVLNRATVTDAAYVFVDMNGTDPRRDIDFDPRSNKWYAMIPTDSVNGNVYRPDGYIPYDFEAGTRQGPSCQQCHGNPRDVDDAWFLSDGSTGGGKYTRHTFPHWSSTPALLTESGDDLCTNCHGTATLP